MTFEWKKEEKKFYSTAESLVEVPPLLPLGHRANRLLVNQRPAFMSYCLLLISVWGKTSLLVFKKLDSYEKKPV